MTITRIFPAWRYASDFSLQRMLNSNYLVEWRAFELNDYFAWPLDLDAFTTGTSDYDLASDEAYCPCGVTMPNWDGSAGHLLRLIYHHCAVSGHPIPRFDR